MDGFFEDFLVDCAKEISKEWSERYGVPMDGDEVEECADIIKGWLDYYQGNITAQELANRR